MRNFVQFVILIAIFSLVQLVSAAAAETLSVISWNLDARDEGEAVAAKIYPEMAACHLLCLTRSDAKQFNSIEKSLGKNFLACEMERPSMQILYDQRRLQCLRQGELKIDEVHSWLGLFRDIETKVDFYVLVNEFAKGDGHRAEAEAIRLWCEQQTLPIIGLGDFGFEVNYESLRGNRPFDEFMRDYRWRWVRPYPLVDTLWQDLDQDDQDDQPNTCSDFIYLGGGALNWLARVKVDPPQGSKKHETGTKGHRPVRLSVDPR